MIFNSKVFFEILTFDRYNTNDVYNRARIRYEEKDGHFCKDQTIESKGLENQIEEIKIFCNKIPYRYERDKKTYSFECYRKICIYEEGGTHQAHNFHDPQKFKFIMSTTNKLIYPQDVKNFVYPYSEIYDTNTPVFILSSDCRYNNEIYFNLRPLGKEEIVVDTNIRQIYPKNADFGMIPKGLTNLLLKGDNCILR